MSNIELSPGLIDFIEENIQLIENKEWGELYNKGNVPPGFTEAMLAADVNPL